MNKNLNIELLKNEILSLGDNIEIIKSLTKYIDLIIDDEINFKKSDIENLLVILKDISQKVDEKYSKIDQMLGL